MIQTRISARSAITSFIFLLSMFGAFAGKANLPLTCSISGASVSCVNQLEFYYTTQTPGYTYTWALTSGGTLSNTTGASTMVNWTSSGTHQVILTETAPGGGQSTCSLVVTVYARPVPKIFTDFISDCQEPPHGEDKSLAVHDPKDKDCWLVCENMTVNYWTTPETGFTYQWTIVGGSPASASGTSVSVIWGSPGAGSIILTATSPGGCSESKTQCVTIIASPTAWFTFNNQTPDQALEICRDETVYFTDLSTGASQWLWNFGDGSTSTAQNPSHNYPGPGTYNGSLTVKNNCGCIDVLPFTVIVTDRVSPNIGCISTLCLGDCAFYSVSNIGNCPDAEIKWGIQGGTIINTTGNGVNVIWDDSDGFIDNNGYGLICVRIGNCPDLCEASVCVRVPIIHKAHIVGPTEVCEGQQVTYYVPNQPGINEQSSSPDGVDFHWWISGNGFIVSQAPYSNSIVVEWYGSGAGTVNLDGYENYLSDPVCQFKPDPLNVTIKPTFSISPTESVACVGQVKTITASGTGSFNWTVNGPGGVTGPVSGGNTYSVTLSLPGTYVVTAQSTSGVYCPTTPSAVIVVNPTPATPTGTITGVTAVCTNTPYTYSMSVPPPPGSIYAWTANGGTVNGGGGQTVSVVWSGVPPMSLSVRTKSTLEPYCESAPLTIPISLYTPPTTFITGPASSCINQTATFQATALSNYTDIQWTIVPATAGSVISGQGTSNINVLFNSNASGVVQIVATAMVCGTALIDTKNVTINQIPVIAINAPAAACENNSVSLSVSPNTGIVSYNWTFGDGGTSTNATPTYTWTTPGSYPINVQMTLNICGNPTVTASKTILINPAPEAVVTATNGFYVCPATNQTTILTVATQFACTYSWSTGSSAATITVSTGGVYMVTATEPGTGCSSVVSVLVVQCGISNPCVTSLTPWTFSAAENCDTYTFTPTPTAANFLGWDFGDGTGSSNPGTVSHTYAHTGYYQVVLYSIDPIQQCTLITVQTVSVKFKGNFSATFNCSSGSMVTTLTDRSEYLAGFAVTPTWYDGSSSIGTGSVLNQVLTPGVHTIYLNANIGGMSCYSPPQSINVPGMPQAIFAHDAPKCEGVPVQFTNNSTGGGLTNFSWNFGDGAFSGISNPQRVYDAPPNSYTVSLTVSNNWGCSATSSGPVSILNRGADPTLTLTPLPPVCEGSSILITASTALPPTVNYTWFNAVAPAVPLQGPSTLNTFTANSNGLYGVHVTDGNGCIYNKLAPQAVVITPPPYINISGNTDVCLGSTFNLSADIGTGFTYHWLVTYPNGSTSTSNNASIVIGATLTGTYSFAVTITNTAAGCTNTGTATGIVHPGITDLTIVSSSLCVPAQLTALGTGITSYNWSEGSNTQQITATQGGQYAVIVSDQWGCTAKGEYFLGSPPDLSNVMTGCYEFCDAVTWQAPNCAGCQYQWTFNGVPIPGEVNSTIKIEHSGVYTVIVTNSYGCQSESGAIEISVGTGASDQCKKCDIKITTGITICRGKDPETGFIKYEFWLTVVNNGGALHGAVVTSDFGNVIVDFPTDGYIPGGGAVTQVHGFMYYSNIQDVGCFHLDGYLTNDCSDPKPCGAKFCTGLEPCCDGKCSLKISEVKAVCLTRGYYKVSAVITNNGCDMFDVYVSVGGGHYPLTPSTIFAGTTVTYTAYIFMSPGDYEFSVCGVNAAGVECCVDAKIKIPECQPTTEVCQLKVKVDQFVCVGHTSDGFTIYNFQLSVGNVPVGYDLQIIPQQLGYVTNLNYSCFGTSCTVAGTLTHYPNSAGICLTVLALSPSDPPKVCLGEVCLDEPHCFGRPSASDPRSAVKLQQGSSGGVNDFNLIPNPATRAVTVLMGTEATSAAQITLVDMLGRQLQVTQNVTDGAIQLDLSSLSSGVFIVAIKWADGSLSSKLLVVEKE